MNVETPVKASPRDGKSTARKPLPGPNSDFYELYGTLKPEELAIVKRVREFMESKVEPIITKYWCEDSFPFELLPAAKELGVGGIGLKGYGCPGGSYALLGFVQMELARTDPSPPRISTSTPTVRSARRRSAPSSAGVPRLADGPGSTTTRSP